MAEKQIEEMARGAQVRISKKNLNNVKSVLFNLFISGLI